jgi:hypothetical protein
MEAPEVRGPSTYTGYEKSRGLKFDQDKVRMDLVPPVAVTWIAKILTFGAKKYGDRNWEQGIKYGRVYAAALRHLFAWWGGEEKDPETGESHIAHALCCLAFLAHYTNGGYSSEFDDRSSARFVKLLTTDDLPGNYAETVSTGSL